MEENNCKWNNWQRFNLQNIQAVHAAQYQKNEQPTQKVGQRTKQTFLQEDIQKANKTHEKICSFLISQHYSLLEKCKLKTRWGIVSASQNGHHKKRQTIAGEGVEKKETLLHCWWECKLVQPLWRTVWKFLKNLGIEPLQYSWLENSLDREAWPPIVHGVSKSQTQLNEWAHTIIFQLFLKIIHYQKK